MKDGCLFGDINLFGEHDLPDTTKRKAVEEIVYEDARGQQQFNFSEPPLDARGNRMLFVEQSGRGYESAHNA